MALDVVRRFYDMRLAFPEMARFVTNLPKERREHIFTLSLSQGHPDQPASVRRGQASENLNDRPVDSSRRLRCQRASNQLLCWVLSLPWRLAQYQQRQTKTWKNLLLWTQRQLNPFQLSQCTQANTSNTTLGQTFGSVLTCHSARTPTMGVL